MRLTVFAVCFCFSLPAFGGSLQLNSAVLDPAFYNVTAFAITLPGPLSMVQLSDGSLAAAGYYPGVIRLTDFDHNGVADDIGTRLFAAPGAHTSMVQAGGYYIDGNFG